MFDFLQDLPFQVRVDLEETTVEGYSVLHRVQEVGVLVV